MINKEKLSSEIHKVFLKYDILGLIRDGFPENEYQMEESKIGFFILNNSNISILSIEKELINIMNDWVGGEMITKHFDYYIPIIKNISKEIYEGLSKFK